MVGPWGLNWTWGFKRLKLDGHESNRTVQKTKSGRSAKVDGPEIQKSTVQREKTVRPEVMNLDGLKG